MQAALAMTIYPQERKHVLKEGLSARKVHNQDSKKLGTGDGINPLSATRRKRIHELYNTAFLLQECCKAIHLKKDQHTHADGRPRRGKNSAQSQSHVTALVHDAAH